MELKGCDSNIPFTVSLLYKQNNKQTNKQTKPKTNKTKNKQTNKQKQKQTNKQKFRYLELL